MLEGVYVWKGQGKYEIHFGSNKQEVIKDAITDLQNMPGVQDIFDCTRRRLARHDKTDEAKDSEYKPGQCEYKTIEVKTEAGIAKAEKLQAEGWKVGETGIDSVQMYRKKGADESVDEKTTPTCSKCNKAHWPFQKCGGNDATGDKDDKEDSDKKDEVVDEETDSDKYAAIARGLEDEKDAQEIARNKKGRVVQDDEDEKKFMVISKTDESLAERVKKEAIKDVRQYFE